MIFLNFLQENLLKLRERALKEKTHAELAWLEQQKKRFRDKGADDQFPMLNKRKRGLLLRLQQEQVRTMVLWIVSCQGWLMCFSLCLSLSTHFTNSNAKLIDKTPFRVDYYVGLGAWEGGGNFFRGNH